MGMLDKLFSTPARDLRLEEQDEERRLQALAQMSPFEAGKYTAYGSAGLAGRGLGNAVGAMAGVDTRKPAKRQQDAIEAAKAEVAALGFDPDDPKTMDQFYRQVVAILRQKGLFAEALAIGQEYAEQKRKGQKLDLETQELQRKKDRDVLMDARARDRIEALAKKGYKAASAIGKMAADMENTADPVTRAALKKAIENASAGKLIVEDLGDKVQLVDATTREVVRTDEKGAAPMNEKAEVDQAEKKAKLETAYKNAKLGMQSQYDAVVELHNLPGLDEITGWWGSKVGAKGTERSWFSEAATALSSDAAKRASDKYDQVAGGAFLAGLNVLKEAGKGSTGLGAVSEVEGAKVQAATTAVGRLQPGPELRTELVNYATKLVASGKVLDGGAVTDKIAVVPLTEKAFVTPTRGRKPKPAAAAPAPAARGAYADPEKERRYQEWKKQNGGG